MVHDEWHSSVEGPAVVGAAAAGAHGATHAGGPSASSPRTLQRLEGRLGTRAEREGGSARGGPPGLGSRATHRRRKLRSRRSSIICGDLKRAGVQADLCQQREGLYSRVGGVAGVFVCGRQIRRGRAALLGKRRSILGRTTDTVKGRVWTFLWYEH